MAENRNITWNVTLKIHPDVTKRYKLLLNNPGGVNLSWGKWSINPPSEISVPEGESKVTVSFKAEGAECSATGTEGTVNYHSTDNPENPTGFAFSFDIPYSAANSGNVTGGSQNYNIDNGGGVPQSGNSVSVDVTITQVEPTY